MNNEKKSRREALRLLGKTGILLGTIPAFFASLKIIPESEAGTVNDLPGAPQFRTAADQEKAFISGSESSLTIKVTGTPGRVFYVSFAAADVRENYRRLPGSEGTINARGTGSVVINTKNITNAKIYFKVITGELSNTSTKLAATEAFVVTLNAGVIASFEGVASRPILASNTVSSQVLIAMAAATSRDNSFQLR
jgi:hypothetical protein